MIVLSDDGEPRRMVEIGTYPGGTNTLVVPADALAMADEKLKVLRLAHAAAIETAAANAAKEQALRNARASGSRLRRFFRLGD